MSSAISSAFGIIWILIWIIVVRSIIKSARSRVSSAQQSRTPVQHYERGQESPAGAGSHLYAPAGKPQRLDEIVYQTVPGEAPNAPRAAAPFAAPRASSKAVQERMKFKGEKGESYSSLKDILQEDRKNDWMARQRAEEARALKRNFSDLGALHDASCAADELKRSHHHDYGADAIDSPEKNAAKSAWKKKNN